MSIIKNKQIDVSVDFDFQNHKLIHLSSPLSNDDAATKLYVDNRTVKSGGTITGDLLIIGDLYISGITTTIDVANLNIRDNILLLNSGETSDHVTLQYCGIEVSRGSGTNYRMVFNDTLSTFQVGLVGNLQSVATRQDAPSDSGLSYWNNSVSRFDTSTKLTYNGTDLYVSGMTSTVTDYVVYYDNVTGQLTYGVKPAGSGGGDYMSTGTTTFNTTVGTAIDTYWVTSGFAVYHYRINSGTTNLRAGTLTIVNNSSTSEIIDVATSDIGDTNGVSFTSIVNGSNIELTVISASDGWSIKYIKIIS